MNDQEELVILYVRVKKSQLQYLNLIAKQEKLTVAQLVRSFLDREIQGISWPVLQFDQLTNIENILIQLSKQTITDLSQVLKITSEIYSTQTMAKQDAPEGVFLLPPCKEKGEFFCQKCGAKTSNKRRHTIKVRENEVKVGDCCFYNDAYKDLIRALL